MHMHRKGTMHLAGLPREGRKKKETPTREEVGVWGQEGKTMGRYTVAAHSSSPIRNKLQDDHMRAATSQFTDLSDRDRGVLTVRERGFVDGSLLALDDALCVGGQINGLLDDGNLSHAHERVVNRAETLTAHLADLRLWDEGITDHAQGVLAGLRLALSMERSHYANLLNVWGW